MADRRTAVISGFAAARAALLAAIAGVDAARLAEPAADGWSPKDHLAHVAHMDEIRYFEVCRVARGHQPAWPYETDAESAALNAMGVEHRRALPLAQLLWELDFIRGRILDELRQAPEAALDPVRYGEFGLDGGAAHEREHAEAILQWRRDRGL